MQTITNVSPASVSETGARKVDVARGGADFSVSKQWMMRPSDERFLSLQELEHYTQQRSDASRTTVIDPRDLRFGYSDEASHEVTVNGSGPEKTFTNWSFGQTSRLLGAPAAYLAKLHPKLAAINLQYMAQTYREGAVKAYTNNDIAELRAVTGPEYGRIFDHEIVRYISALADQDGWKIPGTLDWSTGIYDPHFPVDANKTTLFASDRDLWIFLVDDLHPIEIGKLANGDPDLLFRGFIVSNSEVGNRTLEVVTMYLRAICCNRILWGVEGKQTVRMRHSKLAPDRFSREVRPALASYSNTSTGKLLQGISDARATVVAKDQDSAREFLTDRTALSRKQADQALALVEREEGKPAQSIWDMVQGMSALARDQAHQDSRFEIEREAKKLLDKVA